MRRIKELDGIRAIAILLVFGCHYAGFSRLFHGLPEQGWVGVDIFFVLSGYLITTILLGLKDKDSPYTTFYARRAIRIFPPYFASIALIVIALFLAHNAKSLSPAFLVRQLLFLQAYSKTDILFLRDFTFHLRWYLQHPPSLLLNAHHLPMSASGLEPGPLSAASTYWSLSVEEYFYLLWAPIVLRCSRQLIVAIGFAVCLFEMLLRWYYPGYLVYFGIFFRYDMLIWGAFLALLLERWRRSSVPSWAPRLFAIICAVALTCLVFVCIALHPVVGRELRSSPLFEVLGLSAIGAGVAALLGLLVFHAETSWWFARFLRLRAIQYIGTISYTMYLVHVLVAYVVLMVIVHALHLQPTAFLAGQAIVSVGGTVVVARLSWHFLEKPLLAWKDRRFPGVKTDAPKLD